MLETKVFEIRDRATFFVAFATRTRIPFNSSTPEQEAYLLQRDGFDLTAKPMVILCRSDGLSHYDPYRWSDRTYMNAHWYIADNWEKLQSGGVIDVEFILGETEQPKQSERLDGYKST